MSAADRSLPRPIEDAVRDLYSQHAASMLRYGLTIHDNRDAVQDFVHDVFLRYVIACTRSQQIAKPRLWLFRTLRDHLLSQLRSSTEAELRFGDLPRPAASHRTPETDYGRQELISLAWKAGLTTREVECLQLRAEGLRYEEIAEVLGLRCGTIAALLVRAHKKVRKFVDENAPRKGAFYAS